MSIKGLERRIKKLEDFFEARAKRIAEANELGLTDEDRGLYRKYRVEKVDDPTGKHDKCFHFVLDLTHDPYAIPAIRAYADACRGRYPLLAKDLDTFKPVTTTKTGKTKS